MSAEITRKEGSITFKVADVKLEKIDVQNLRPFNHKALQQRDDKTEHELLQGSIKEKCYMYGSHSFVHAAAAAYSRHYHLVVRPDDVWMAILTQFSSFVNLYPEELRDKFVSHEGQKELEVSAAGSLRSADYAALARMMEEQISKNIKDPNIRTWLVPNFSTTTSSDRVVGAVVLMATLQKYFSYKFSLCCGLPSVTLLGTVADWEDVRRRAERLVEFDVKAGIMKRWSTKLLPVLDNFVASANGKVDVGWWNRIAHRSGGGSGPRYLSGWITVFCVFNDAGKWIGDECSDDPSDWLQIDTNDLPLGYASVPVLINDNGTEYNTTMYAGHIAADIREDDTAIAPRLDWVIVNNGNKE